MMAPFIFNLLYFMFFSSAEPIENHSKQLVDISKRTERFEQQFADLQVRKNQAREGEELEMVISDIGKTHKNLMELRRERNALREHLNKEHPDSPLVYDSTLYKNFDKSRREKGPLDDKLDNLLKLMKEQYGQYIVNTPQERTAARKKLAEPGAKDSKGQPIPVVIEVPEAVTAASAEETKNKYMRNQIKTEMKIQSDAAAPKKKSKAHDEKTEEKAEEKGHGEAKPAAHH